MLSASQSASTVAVGSGVTFSLLRLTNPDVVADIYNSMTDFAQSLVIPESQCGADTLIKRHQTKKLVLNKNRVKS